MFMHQSVIYSALKLYILPFITVIYMSVLRGALLHKKCQNILTIFGTCVYGRLKMHQVFSV